MTHKVPLPKLSKVGAAFLEVYTDEALWNRSGVRIAFTTRHGGVSKAPYASLNLARGIGDEKESVEENRRRVAFALGVKDVPCIVPRQVHGTSVVTLRARDDEAFSAAQRRAAEGVDGVVITVPDKAALLCFADCVPLIIVAPSGAFAVIHAGWRGVLDSVSRYALEALVAASDEQVDKDPALYNVYIGPHIQEECFEIDPSLAQRFSDAFGSDCRTDENRVDLYEALQTDLFKAGIVDERIIRVGLCTVCRNDEFFSYRHEGGTCGRHGAYAVRVSDIR